MALQNFLSRFGVVTIVIIIAIVTLIPWGAWTKCNFRKKNESYYNLTFFKHKTSNDLFKVKYVILLFLISINYRFNTNILKNNLKKQVQ